MTEFVTPHLRSVLKTYQDSATKSLQGPGSTLVVAPYPAAMKKEVHSPDLSDESIIAPPPLPPPEISQPILSVADTGRGVLYETYLEGKPIGCFLLGGEMRLCFPQVLNNVLTDFGVDQINRIFDDLRIFCSQCTPEQLHQFKAAKILPEDVNSSGLITRTNAERLCSALLHHPEHPRIISDAITFKVVHRCFGKCEGICTPDLYSAKEPACIRCIECSGMFSPQKFVCHVHQQQENSTLHWGFDSNNWRAYLHVAEDEVDREKYSGYLDELNSRDSAALSNLQRDASNLKRKAEIDEPAAVVRQPCKKEPLDIPPKKVKYSDESYFIDFQQYQQAMILAQYRHPYHGFRPWAQLMPPQQLSAASAATAKHIPHMPYGATVATIALPYLSQEPPILQNPERVVRLSECERFEQSYQPNVALVPRVSGKSGSTTTTTTTVVNGKERDKTDFECGEVGAGLDRDRNRDETDAIDVDVKIKKERPQTPSEKSLSPEPRSESPRLLATSLPPITNPAPISPEGQSGSSNEITSSTSPVPASNTASHKTNEPTKTSPPPSSIDNHHIHHLMLRSHHQLSKSSSIGPLHQLHHHGDSNNLDSHVSLSNGIYHHQHHKTNGVAGSSEFELSTDTDDDSLVGEADSSNNIATLDIAIEALKDTRPQERDKVLGIIKALLADNIQANVKNAKLKQELRRKDDEIAELQRKSNNDSTNSSQCSSNNANTTTTTTSTPNGPTTIKASPEQSLLIDMASTTKTSSTPPKVDTPTVAIASAAANVTTATTIIEVGTGGAIELSTTATNAALPPRKKCETEVIRMPLKKSARRSPAEETLVIMQPHKLRDEARDKPRDKLDKILRYLPKSPSPNPIQVQQSNLIVTAKANEAT